MADGVAVHCRGLRGLLRIGGLDEEVNPRSPADPHSVAAEYCAADPQSAAAEYCAVIFLGVFSRCGIKQSFKT